SDDSGGWARVLGALHPGFAGVPAAGARGGVGGGPLGSGGPRSRLCRAPGRVGNDGPVPRGPSGSRQVAATESAAGACPQRPPDGDALVPVSYKSSPIWAERHSSAAAGAAGAMNPQKTTIPPVCCPAWVGAALD